MCGENLVMWRSVPPTSKTYLKGTKTLEDSSKLPSELQKAAVDVDKNGTPDYLDTLINAAKSGDTATVQKYSQEELAKFMAGQSKPDGTPLIGYNPRSGEVEVGGLTDGNIEMINSRIDEVVRGLGCGFGGGGCINSPLNYAPLAPGSSPTLFGYPLMPLMPGTGIPVFANPTIGVPPVWPPSPTGAGGWLDGIPTGLGISQFRFFITPTITGAVGTAVCYGSNAASLVKWPPGFSPVLPGGNCVVAAMPLASCKDDGSDGDAGSLGLGLNSGANTYVNANSCVQSPASKPLLSSDRNNLLRYVGGDNSVLPEINASMARGGISSISRGPVVGIGKNSGGDSSFEFSFDSSGIASFDLGRIIKIKNKRVSAFPDFLMDWVTRQLEEVVNKLTSLPTLYVVLPDFTGLDLK